MNSNATYHIHEKASNAANPASFRESDQHQYCKIALRIGLGEASSEDGQEITGNLFSVKIVTFLTVF